MTFFTVFSIVIGALFTVLYSYQFFYIFVSILKKDKVYPEADPRRYAVLIAARNEEAVIGNLLDSIKNQDYPSENINVYVVADNCTDRTAEICREKGANVYERQNKEEIGKGYALDFLIKHLYEEGLDKTFDAFMVFDADNVLEPTFVKEINKVYAAGYKVVTSYRNTKNFGDSWISYCNGLWYLRESRYLQHPRHKLGISCTVSGTGFLFDKTTIEDKNGWPYHLLIEDVQFSADFMAEGNKIGYAKDAELYDEQPIDFRTSWNQRIRWGKGYMQVLRHYTGKLIKGFFGKGGFSCYDIIMNITPAMILTIIGTIVNIVAVVYGLIAGDGVLVSFMPLILSVVSMSLCALAIGGVTLITEWKSIHCGTAKKILYLFTFPLFMISYIPIVFVALFKKVTWKPIKHVAAKSLDEITSEGEKK
ncbi:MAG: glycosyltransferase family 2 protein [Clostridia bacterium]|nr:glycosyltransferase family 2 protein [Clostridia bacterium]